MKKIRKCESCGKYTLSLKHCGKESINAHPPRYDPHDRYGDYRRKRKGVS